MAPDQRCNWIKWLLKRSTMRTCVCCNFCLFCMLGILRLSFAFPCLFWNFLPFIDVLATAIHQLSIRYVQCGWNPRVNIQMKTIDIYPTKKTCVSELLVMEIFFFHMYRGIVVIIRCVTIQMITVEKYVMMAAVSVLIFFSMKREIFFLFPYFELCTLGSEMVIKPTRWQHKSHK